MKPAMENSHTDNQPNSSNTNHVFTVLREEILSKKYKIGERIFENEVAKRFDTSRTPVREAFRKLELFGLVKIIPNKGVFVLGYSKQDIEDIFIITNEIDRQATILAFKRITKDELTELEESLGLMEFYLKKQNLPKVMEHYEKFHNIIYAATKSRYFSQVIREFQVYTEIPLSDSLYYSIENMEKSLEEHTELYNAFCSSDYEKLIVVINHHLEQTSIRVAQVLENNGFALADPLPD